jgi:hypothetical protein
MLLQSDNWDVIKPQATAQRVSSSSSSYAQASRKQAQQAAQISIKHDIRKYDSLQTYSYAQSNLVLPSSSFARTQADSSTSLPDSPMIHEDEDITAYSSSDEETDEANIGNSSTATHNLSTQVQIDEDEILSDDSDIDLSFLDAKSMRASSSSKPSSGSSLSTKDASKPTSNTNTCNPQLQFLPSPYKYYRHISDLQVSPIKLAFPHPCLSSDSNVPFCYSKEVGEAR